MNNAKIKHLAVEVDGELVLKFPVISVEGSTTFERVEAVIASNPVLRLVETGNIEDIWNGMEYAPPT